MAIMVIKRSHIHCHYLAHFWHLQIKVMVIMVDIDIDEQPTSDISKDFSPFSDTFSSSVNPTSILLVKFNILPETDAQISNKIEKETLQEFGGDWLTVTYPAMEGWKGDKSKFEL